MDFLNIDKVLGKTKNRIYLIGVELEGGWKKLPEEGLQLHHDGSVVFPPQEVPENQLRQMQQGLRQRPAYRQLHVGEIPSPIMEVDKMPAWVEKYHPTDVNQTCGLHVHMSFKSAKHYSWLMEKWFPYTMVEYLARWAKEQDLPKTHCIWDRLAGKSDYCKLDGFAPDHQARTAQKIYDRGRQGHRYTVINYCYSQHSTLECRVLPMMGTAKQSVSAIKRVLDITNACILTIARKEEKHSTEVQDLGTLREEIEIPLTEVRERRSSW